MKVLHPKMFFSRVLRGCSAAPLLLLGFSAPPAALALATIKQNVAEFAFLSAIPSLNQAVLSLCTRVLLCRYNATILIHEKIGSHKLAVRFIRGPHPYLFS